MELSRLSGNCRCCLMAAFMNLIFGFVGRASRRCASNQPSILKWLWHNPANHYNLFSRNLFLHSELNATSMEAGTVFAGARVIAVFFVAGRTKRKTLFMIMRMPTNYNGRPRRVTWIDAINFVIKNIIKLVCAMRWMTECVRVGVFGINGIRWFYK